MYIYPADVYNAQLSNEPAEELARILVETSQGAFAQVGFVSGGEHSHEMMRFKQSLQ